MIPLYIFACNKLMRRQNIMILAITNYRKQEMIRC